MKARTEAYPGMGRGEKRRSIPQYNWLCFEAMLFLLGNMASVLYESGCCPWK